MIFNSLCPLCVLCVSVVNSNFPLTQLSPEPLIANSTTAQDLSEGERTNFAAKYVNGPQTWEIVVRDGKLFYKRDAGDVELKKTATYRLSFGEKLENDLMFVADARGRIQYIFDGLYSAKKL